jgi:hypothetical protein
MGRAGDQQQPADCRRYLEALAERPDEVDFISGPERGSRVSGRDQQVKPLGFHTGGEEWGAEVAAKIGQDEATRGQPQRDRGGGEGDPHEGAACFHVCDQCVCLYHLCQFTNLPSSTTDYATGYVLCQVLDCWFVGEFSESGCCGTQRIRNKTNG